MDKEALSILFLIIGFAGFFYSFYNIRKLKNFYVNSSKDEYSYTLGPEALRIRKHAIAGVLIFFLTPLILLFIKQY